MALDWPTHCLPIAAGEGRVGQIGAAISSGRCFMYVKGLQLPPFGFIASRPFKLQKLLLSREAGKIYLPGVNAATTLNEEVEAGVRTEVRVTQPGSCHQADVQHLVS